jgi:hypothetical protein
MVLGLGLFQSLSKPEAEPGGNICPRTQPNAGSQEALPRNGLLAAQRGTLAGRW